MVDPVAPKAAVPRRGKFLSGPALPPPSSSNPGNTRSLGGPLHISPGTTYARNIGDAAVIDSTEDLRAHVHNLKSMAAARRRAIESQRKSVLDDLDEAEDIVLALLESASSVAEALSEMTIARSSTKRHGERRNGGVDGDSFEDLVTRVRSSGVGYSAGVKKLHQLLAPHAHYVKSLNLSEIGTSTDGREDRSNSNGILGAASSISVSDSLVGGPFGRIVEETTSNMYAVRVKMRLAMERCEVLRQMIQLEDD